MGRGGRWSNKEETDTSPALGSSGLLINFAAPGVPGNGWWYGEGGFKPLPQFSGSGEAGGAVTVSCGFLR